MKSVVSLAEADEEAEFGAKAVGLGDAIRGGLPVPPGVALSGDAVEAIASGDEDVVKRLAKSVRTLTGPLAVRSSCVDEDGAEASFAGQHLTLLNVLAADDLEAAVREVWWSANSDSAITYRQRVGQFTRPSVGVVVQSLLNPEIAGVMFTTNPVTGASERMIEATWGLGEAVVAGRVIPDSFRVDPSGAVLDRTPGLKKIAIRPLPEGGTVDEEVAADRAEELCLDDAQLQQLNDLAAHCERIYGMGRDIEWAFADGQLYLLQCRAVTRGGASKPADEPAVGDRATVVTPAQVLHDVPLFAELNEQDLGDVARLFKERRFAAGETVAKEGAGGAAFYVIGSGEATVSIRGTERATLTSGDYFGEIALIDEGARTATITATTELVCFGLTLWDFRPLVERHPTIGWKLLQALAQRLREAHADGT